jgi:hypothetical protein
MIDRLKKAFNYACIIFLLIGFYFSSGCVDNSFNPIDPSPTDIPPSFTLRSETITVLGEERLLFFAKCTSDEILIDSIRIRNPRAESETINFNGIRIQINQEFECQKTMEGFRKYLGTWTVTFMGRKAVGLKSKFSVTKSLNITMKIKSEISSR